MDLWTEHDREQLARESIEAFNRGDWQRMRDSGQRIEGVDATIAAMEAWKTTMPDITTAVVRVVVDGDTTATEIIWRGTQTGPLNTGTGVLPPSGKSAQTYATLWTRWQGGKVVEDRHHMDILSLLAQIGALPAPSTT